MAFYVGQKEVEGYEGLYVAKPNGRIFSLRSRRCLKGSPNPSGYLLVALYRDGVAKTHAVHRLIARAFIPNPSDKPSVNHIDGSKTNNAASNLEWCTPKENTLHGVALGTIKGVTPKLTAKQQDEIRRLKSQGLHTHYLAGLYAVSASTIKNVLRARYGVKPEAMLNPSDERVSA